MIGVNDNLAKGEGSIIMSAPPAAVALLLAMQVAVAEVLIVAGRTLLGLIVHIVAGAAMLVAIHRANEQYRAVFQSLFLLPVFRLFSLGLPRFTGNDLEFLGAVYLVYLGSVIVIARSQSPPFDSRSVTLWSGLIAIPGVVLGAGIGVLGHGVLSPTLQYPPTAQNHAIAVLVTGVLVAVTEETVFRRMLQSQFATVLNEWASIGIVSVLFAAMHGVWAPQPELIVLFAGALSIILGVLYYRFRSLSLIVAVHGSVNATALVIVPIVGS